MRMVENAEQFSAFFVYYFFPGAKPMGFRLHTFDYPTRLPSISLLRDRLNSSERAYIFQRTFLRGLYSEGLIIGGKFAFQNRLGL